MPAAAPQTCALRLAAVGVLLAALCVSALAVPGEAQSPGGGTHAPPGGNGTAPSGNSTHSSNSTTPAPGNSTGTDPTAPSNQTSPPPSQPPDAPRTNGTASRSNGTANATWTGDPPPTGPSAGTAAGDASGNATGPQEATASANATEPADNGTSPPPGNASVGSLPPVDAAPPDDGADGGGGGAEGDRRGAEGTASLQVPAPLARALTGAFALSTGTALVLVLASWSRPQRLLLLLPLLPLFSRIARGRLLEHAARRHLLDLIEASPGIHYRELERRAGRGHGAVEHHLRSLVRAGLVRVHVEGGRTRYFPPPARGDLSLEQRSVLLAERARHVLGCVARHGELPLAGLARAAGLPASTLHACVGKLQAARLVESVRVGREVRVGLTDGGRRALGQSSARA